MRPYQLIFAEANAPENVPLFSTATIAVLGGLIIVLIILLLVYSQYKKKEEEAKNAGFVTGDAGSAGHMRKFYYVITSFPIFRPAIRRLEAKLKPIYPSDDAGQIKEFLKPLVKIILITMAVGILTFVVGFGLKPSLYTFVAACFITYAAGTLIAMSIVKSEQNRFKDDFAQLVSRIGHYFYLSGNIVNAIEQASGRSGRLMKLHCIDFKNILESENMEMERRLYMEKDKDKFLKLFLSQAEIVKKSGNAKDTDGNSIFLSSMTDLINALQEDKRRAIEKQYGFIFFGWVASIPCILQPYIAEFCMYTIGALAAFYVGRSGNLWKILLLSVSYFAFRIIAILQDDSGEIPANPLLNSLIKNKAVMRFIDIFHDPDSQKVYKIKTIMRRSGDQNNYRVYYVKRILAALVMGCSVFLLCFFGHRGNKEFLKNETITLEDACNNADSKQKAVIFELVPQYMERLTKTGERPTAEELEADIILEPGIRTKEAAEDMTAVIMQKIETYDHEYFDFRDVFYVILAAVLAFFGPAVIMLVRKVVIKDRVGDEIVRFQTIVNMMRKLPGVLPSTILITMEQFSVVYKRSLRECISTFSSDPEKALERLYYTEKEDDFRMIIEDFMRVPRTGIEKSFSEVTTQIKNYTENRKQEQTHAVIKLTKAAMWIAIVPACLLIFGYMLGPFLMGVGDQFNSLTGTLSGIK